jgi:D-glycero-alpha-D-manno-heptose-7-phosphate kinase
LTVGCPIRWAACGPERACAAGALGGKIAGAGGGGFLLLYCPKSAQARVREALHELQSLDVRLDWSEARIAFAQ